MGLQRSSLVLLLVIALLAGFAARPLVFPPLPVDNRPVDGTTHATARAFYDALNRALVGEGIDPLAGMLSSIFVDHVSETGEGQSADAFLAKVRSLGASSQRIRLEVLSVDVVGGNVVVALRQGRDGAVQVAGITLETPRPAPYYEVIRVERGKVADRWAPAFQAIDATESSDAPMVLSSFSGIVTRLERLELTGSVEHAWRSVGLGLMVVESGAAIVQVSRGDSSDAPVALGSGSFRPIPPGVRVRVRSADGNALSVLNYMATRNSATDVSTLAGAVNGASQGASRTVLWNGPIHWMESATMHQPARIVLPAGDRLTLTRPADADLLLGANGAGVEIGAPGGSVTTLGDDRWPVESTGTVVIDASHAGLIGGDGVVFLRNDSDGPVTITLICIEKEAIGEQPRIESG